MTRTHWTGNESTAVPGSRRTVSGVAIAVGLTIALFPPLTAADLYLSADRSGILPVNAVFISSVSLSSAFGLILIAGIIRDRGRSLCLAYFSAGPVLFAFALLTVVLLAGGFLPEAYWAAGGKFVYLSLYGFIVLMLSVGIASSPTFRQYHRVILGICLLSAIATIFIDVFYPGTFSKLYTRPAGFMKNPNGGALVVTLLAIATVDWTRSRASDMFLWLVAGTAVVATLSRGGVVLFAFAFLYYSIVVARSGMQLYAKRLVIPLVAVMIAVPVYMATNLGSTVYSAENRRVRLLAAFLSGETETVIGDSRVGLASHYIELISEHPILGHGTGFVKPQPQGPHNTFLTLWVENGILGLAAYLSLFAVAFWHFRRSANQRGQTLCAAALVLSFFNNDALDERTLIVALGLLSGLAAPEIATRRLSGLRPFRWIGAPLVATPER